jgi:hypothetical protein
MMMKLRSFAARRMLWAIEALVLAPVLAAVIIGALLLFGVSPRLVFLPGHFVMSTLATLGVRVSNRVGVMATGVAWWAALVTARLALARLTGKRRPTTG